MKSPILSTAQLAESLGLSRWTVSRALNGHPGIHPATAERVREAVRREGFSPNILGRGLRAGRTDLVGVSLPDLEDYFLAAKVSRLQDAVAERHRHPVLQINRGDAASEVAALERFAAMRCGAVVLIASQLPNGHPALRQLAAAGVRLVFIDPLHPQSGEVVATDRRMAMKEALGHLRALGHRRLATAGINPVSPYGRQRVAGLRQACRKWGWDFARQIVLLDHPENCEDTLRGQRIAADYLRSHYPRTRAIIAVNDRIALGLMHALQRAGLRIPEDVSILGYDDAPFAAAISPELTTIDPRVDELIDEAVGRLFGQQPLPPGWVRPKLKVRESTAAPAPRAARLSQSPRSGSRRR